MTMAYYTGESLQVSKLISKLINADNEILHPRYKVCDAKIKSNSTINFNSFSAGQKWAKFTTSNVYFISRQPFTAMWPIISHFKVYKMGFSEKNKSYHRNPALF